MQFSISELNEILKELVTENGEEKTVTISMVHIRKLAKFTDQQLNREKDQIEKELERLGNRSRKVQSEIMAAKRTRDAADSRINDGLTELHQLRNAIHQKQKELDMKNYG